MVERGTGVTLLRLTTPSLIRPPPAVLFFFFFNIFAGLPFVKIPKDEKEDG